ncbi:MAG: carboxypeptidase-like regulatory domain-containing protein [Janthinobacterium lividum]
MALNAHPFHSTTGDLLPSYRDAYLRGDLSVKNTDLVDAYLKANPVKGVEAFERFHTLKEKGHAVQPVGWLQHQFHLIRTEPVRFRQRAGSLLLVGALVSGAAFATSHKTSNSGRNVAEMAPTLRSPETLPATIAAAEALASTTKMAIVNGRILDENGHPLIGATVLDKNSGRGVSTDAQGNYVLAVPTNQAHQLQFGYGGYSEEEVKVQGRSVQNVTLLPRTDMAKKRHWWKF